MTTRLSFVLGTRPEIIKLAPVITACQERDISFTVVHTGQHYSEQLDTVFFEQLDLPTPDYNLEVASGNHGEQTGEMLIRLEEVLISEQPSTVIVQGDTNSVLAGALATSKLAPDLGHVEAGLRSFDDRMPEETNRVLTDHASDLLFAPTQTAAEQLRQEGIPDDDIYLTGNTIVDAVEQYADVAATQSSVLEDHDLTAGQYVLLTAHRAENVDDDATFQSILDGTASLATQLDVPVIYPIHPRAASNLESFDIELPDSIRTIEPLDYLDFLHLESEATVIVTDSGGVQEEACILGTPCITVRESTERPETTEVGANRVVGTEPADIEAHGTEMASRATDWDNPFGDGEAAGRILDAVLDSDGLPATKN